jgi:hypothetical protein
MAGVEMQITVTDCDMHGRWNEVPIPFEMYGIGKACPSPTNVQIDMVGPQRGCECHQSYGPPSLNPRVRPRTAPVALLAEGPTGSGHPQTATGIPRRTVERA